MNYLSYLYFFVVATIFFIDTLGAFCNRYAPFDLLIFCFFSELCFIILFLIPCGEFYFVVVDTVIAKVPLFQFNIFSNAIVTNSSDKILSRSTCRKIINIQLAIAW